MDNENLQLIELRKLVHLLRSIAVTLIGGVIGVLLFAIGARVEIGSGFDTGRFYYLSGFIVIAVTLIGAVVEGLKADKEVL